MELARVNMQGRDQDNSDMPLTDDVAETILSDFDEAALDEIEKSTPTLSDAALSRETPSCRRPSGKTTFARRAR